MILNALARHAKAFSDRVQGLTVKSHVHNGEREVGELTAQTILSADLGQAPTQFIQSRPFERDSFWPIEHIDEVADELQPAVSTNGRSGDWPTVLARGCF